MNLIQLALADNGEIDIPATSITFVEGLETVKNSHFPDAQSFIRYSIGDTDHIALVKDSFDAVRTVTMVGGAPDWCEAVRDTGNPIRFRASHVDMRKTATGENIQSEIGLVLNRSNARATFQIRQTVEEVRTMMAPPPPGALPAGVIELPPAEPTPNRHERRSEGKEN